MVKKGRNLAILILVACAVSVFLGVSAAWALCWRVVRVIDGDTVAVRSDIGEKMTIRIIGIDCPESSANSKCRKEGKRGGQTCEEQIPAGRAATTRAQELLLNKVVSLEEGLNLTDWYGRELRYIRVNGRDFGLIMISEGYCKNYRKYPHPRKDDYSRFDRPPD